MEVGVALLESLGAGFYQPKREIDTMTKVISHSVGSKVLDLPLPSLPATLGEAMEEVRARVERYCLRAGSKC